MNSPQDGNLRVEEVHRVLAVLYESHPRSAQTLNELAQVRHLLLAALQPVHRVLRGLAQPREAHGAVARTADLRHQVLEEIRAHETVVVEVEHAVEEAHLRARQYVHPAGRP